MAIETEELVKRLITEDPIFRQSYDAHREYERRVSKLEKKPVLTADEIFEKAKLKKAKLTLKDEMQRILAKHQ